MKDYGAFNCYHCGFIQARRIRRGSKLFKSVGCVRCLKRLDPLRVNMLHQCDKPMESMEWLMVYKRKLNE